MKKQTKLAAGTFYQKSKKLHKLGLTWKALLAYDAIAFHCDKDLTCFPSMATMAEVVGVGCNTVRDGIKELVAAGVVFTAGRGKDGEQWSNKYVIQPISRWGQGAADRNIRAKQQVSQDYQEDHGWTLPEFCGVAN